MFLVVRKWAKPLFFIGFLVFALPQRCFAHVGGGPPFLQVNGVFAQTNPYYQGDAAFNIPQDIPPTNYPVNKLIHLEIDTNNLLIPKNIADHSIFRWSLETGQTFYQTDKKYDFGKAIDKTFTKTGSYLLVIEAHAATEYDFTIIDTVQLNIIDSIAYQTPKVAILIGTKSTKNIDPVTYMNTTTFDPSVKSKTYLWDLGDGKLKTGQSVMADYTSNQPLSYVYARVIDDHGFVNDVGFDVWDTNGNLTFHPFGNMTKAAYKTVPLDQLKRKVPQKSDTILWILVIPPVLLLIFVSVRLFRKKK